MTKRIFTLLMVGTVAMTAVSGCGGESAKSAHIKPDDMPSGQEWTGVYFHPVFGYLHIVEQDTNIIGKWKRTDQSAWGELFGVKTGNVAHFTWKEHKYGLVGASAESKGKGYFQYKVNTNSYGELDGQWGLGADETGSEWRCVKQQNIKPDLKSITGQAPDQSGSPAALD